MAHRLDFTTDRMKVMHWRDQLADPLSRARLAVELSHMLTPEVLRHLPATFRVGDGPDAIHRWIDERDAEADIFLITRRGVADAIGVLILAEIPEKNTSAAVHLGYLFSETAWGQGYATEMMLGLIRQLQSQGDQVTLIGGVERGNEASARVLLKAGFTLAPDLSDEVTDMFTRRLH